MRIVMLLPVLLVVGCGGGGGDDGGGGATYDLNGWWQQSFRQNGTEDPYQPAHISPVQQSGSTVVLGGFTYTLQGDALRSVSPSTTDPDRSERTIEILSNDLLEGVIVGYTDDTQTSWSDVRAERTAAPDGSFTMDGTIGATPVSVDSSTAYAYESTNPAGPTFAIIAEDWRLSGKNALLLLWKQLPPIAMGEHMLGASLDTAVADAMGLSGAQASAGSVDIHSITADHVAGTYSFNLVGGGSVDGAFDLDIRIRFGP